MEKIFKLVVSISTILMMVFSPMVSAVVSGSTISIDTINGESAPFDFICPTNPLFSPVTLTGSGAGEAPPGLIEQYHAQIDWGDGMVTNDLGTFVPPSGQGAFTFTFTAGPHSYDSGTYTIKARLYHSEPPGQDNQADDIYTIQVCIVSEPPILVVQKSVINDDGGTLNPSDFSIHVKVDGQDVGNSPASGSEIGTTYNLAPETYIVSEEPTAGYTATIGGDCNPDGSITLNSGEVKTCTITNDDIATQPYCGDEIQNGDEECDGTDGVGDHQTCSQSCTLIDLTYCGDTIKQTPNEEGTGGPLNDGYEECDDTDGVGDFQSCNSQCVLIDLEGCGNGVKEGTEECDDGDNVSGDGCSATCQIEPATIYAYKVVCQSETDLPNWGNGGSDITETTAQDFVNGNQNCHLEEDWSFEWAYAGTANPGDNIIGPAGGAWTTFGPTDSNGLAVTNISSLSGDRIWVREVMQEEYIPFSGDTSAPRDDVSAEIYCHNDVLNYDNYDYIINPVLGETYYCVAFNAPVEPTTYTVTFDGNGGTPGTQTATTTEGGIIDPLPTVTRDGYNFVEWNTASDGSGDEFTTSTAVTGDITVYAQWSEVPPTPVDGFCGTAAQSYSYAATDFDGDLCSEGTANPTDPVFPDQGDSVIWACEGLNGGADVACEATRGTEPVTPVNGFCGTAAQSYSYAATDFDGDLCSEGTANPTDPVFPDQGGSVGWTCEGLNGGSNATCEAARGTTPSPVYGCTDPTATNYNSSATADDGSCTYSRSGGYAPGQVLGEEIVEPCGLYLYEYIQYGADNNPEEVKKLQVFLNDYMGSNLPITGIYDLATMQALKQFQVQCKEEVLRPWVEDGGTLCDENQPTGYVYKTTQRWINLIMCPTLNLPMPDLSGYPKADCLAYLGAVLGEEVLAQEDGTTDGVVEDNGGDGEVDEATPTEEEITPLEIGGETETEERGMSTLWFIIIIILVVAALIWFVFKGMKR